MLFTTLNFFSKRLGIVLWLMVIIMPSCVWAVVTPSFGKASIAKIAGPTVVQPSQQLYYFISFAMPPTLIEHYLKDAAKLSARVVLRGIAPGQTLKQFILGKVYPLLQKINFQGSVEIDPRLFKQFQVTQVPTFVLYTAQPVATHWQVAGAVSTLWMLDLFAQQGAAVEGYVAQLNAKANSVP